MDCLTFNAMKLKIRQQPLGMSGLSGMAATSDGGCIIAAVAGIL